MSIYDFLRKFFIGRDPSVPNRSDSELRNDFRNPIWDSNEGDDSDNDFRRPSGDFSFNVYSNPLEMHQYFEQQMNEMLKNFFMMEPFQEMDSFFGSGFNPGIENSPSYEPFQQIPAIEEPKSGAKESPKSLRDELLKPEFRHIEKPSDKVDTVLDGKIDASDIASALERKNSFVPIWSPNDSEKSLVPKRDTFTFSSGRSIMSRVVRRPDGSFEREETVKNSDGSETKTVTRRLGDHEYSITTHKDASGAEQSQESYKNIDPEKLPDFNKAWDIHSSKWWSWWTNDKKPDFWE